MAATGEPFLSELSHLFGQHYGGARPTWLVRAPGRVNLIGEHIDYNLLPVLPMAIDRTACLAFRPRDDGLVRLHSSKPDCPAREFMLAAPLEPFEQGDWGNYAKAAAQVMVERYGACRGFDAVLHSTIPVAAGLSSSSAIVVAVALALLLINDADVRPFDLMELLAEGERYVGLRGGGMDQAIILGARRGSALCVSFAPLRLEMVPVPRDWRFIVAHSLERAEKSGAARDTYNARTSECRRALDTVIDHLGVRGSINGYRDLIDEVGPASLLESASKHLDGELLRRFRHVVTEADRVLEGVRALEGGDLAEFGPLMCDSHRSLRDDYAVSTPALDEITEIAVAAGAAGARLTGAGLGGCAVVACTSDKEEQVLGALRTRFYEPRRAENLDDTLFVAYAGDGAHFVPI